MKRGDIYLLNCDIKVKKYYKKVRPVLIIQSTQTLDKSDFVIVMPISTKYKKGEKMIIKDRMNKLVKNSAIKVHQISSFKKERLIYKIGELNYNYFTGINHFIKQHLDLRF